MQSRVMLAAALAGAMFVCALAATDAQQKAPAVPAPAAKKSPFLKLAEPWPDDDVLLARRTEADSRRLFKDLDPLEFTLTADFNTINKDRNPESTKRFPGVLSPATASGRQELNVRLGTRGHFRLMARNCSFVPLRVEFARDAVGETVFEGQTALKLGTHCQNEAAYEQYTLREYTAYRLFNLVTPRSFRARLARGTYVDAKSKKTLTTRYALFLEHENDVARRLGGREIELPRLEFKDVDRDALTTMMLFEYMIGNTDYSLWVLHNIRIVQDKKKTLIPVPYDFDISGLVNPPYATADPRFGLGAVTNRLYRGPCRTVEEFDQAASLFRDRRADMMAIIQGQKDLTSDSRAHMKEYLEGFFRAIDRPQTIQSRLVNGCKPQPTM